MIAASYGVKKGKDFSFFGGEGFEAFAKPSFKFVLLIQADKKKDIPAIEVFEMLESISEGIFQMDIKIKTDPVWDSEYFGAKIPKNAKKVYLASHDGKEDCIKEDLIKSGVNPSIIQQF